MEEVAEKMATSEMEKSTERSSNREILYITV